MGQENEKERNREIYLIMLKVWEKLGEMVVKNTSPKMVKLLVAKYLTTEIALVRKNVTY